MSLFGNTVDRITSSLGYMVSQLEAHEQAMIGKAVKHSERANAELEKERGANVEAAKARSIAKKIGELLK